MGSLAPHTHKHKVTVVGSGNWYVVSFVIYSSDLVHRNRQDRQD